MTDDTHDVGLTALIIEGIAHRLAIDGETLIFAGVGLVPALQGAVQMGGIDADQHIADDGLAGDEVTALFETTAKAGPGLRPQALGPVGDGLVSAHATQDGPGDQAENRGQAMSPSLTATGVGDGGEERGEGLHLNRSEPHGGTSYPVR